MRFKFRYSVLIGVSMTNRKTGFWIFLMMFVCSLALLPAQEGDSGDGSEDDGPAIESDWSVFNEPSYERGDKMFSIGLGLIFPVTFKGASGTLKQKVNLGGTGYLAFDYFLFKNFAVGAEVNGSFNSTYGENMLYLVPIGLRFTYQLVFHPIEIPITMAVGMAPQKYLDQNYLGLYLKPTLGVYWRFNSSWSFGVNGAWWWLPQWTKNSAENAYGNFATLTIAARYHF